MRGHAINHQTTWHSQGQGCCRCLLISPHNRVWKYHPPSQCSHDYLKGGWAGGYLCITCLWTCLPPPLVGPLMKLWRSQGNVSPNSKCLLTGPSSVIFTALLMEYSSLFGNLHGAWWMHWSLESPSSPPENLSLQAPVPSPSPAAVFFFTCPWWGKRGAASGKFLRLWPHGRVRSARFVAFCFVNFRDFCDFAEYGVVRTGLS